MNFKESFKDLILRFKEILKTKEEKLKSFSKDEVQREAWFNTAFYYFLDNEKYEGRIANFETEVLPYLGSKKVDFKINISTSSGPSELWIELKHWLIGYQKEYLYNSQFYFGDKSSVGIKPDVENLINISNNGKFILILATKNPGIDDWTNGVNKFNTKFSPLNIKSITNPSDFPSFYYLGILHVKKLL